MLFCHSIVLSYLLAWYIDTDNRFFAETKFQQWMPHISMVLCVAYDISDSNISN